MSSDGIEKAAKTVVESLKGLYEHVEVSNAMKRLEDRFINFLKL